MKMPIKFRQSTFGPLAEIDAVREALPDIAIALDQLVAAVAAARAENAVAKATGGPTLLTIDGPGIRVTITNGHAG